MKKPLLKLIALSGMLFAISTTTNAQWTRNAATQQTYLTNTGDNVGIGTTNPQFKLDIQSAGAASMSFKSSANNANVIIDRGGAANTAGVNYRTAGTPYWQTGMLGTDNFAIRNIALGAPALSCNYTTNFVGLGTTAPANKLHVVGNANITGNLGIGSTAPLTKLHVESTTSYGTDQGTVRLFGNNDNVNNVLMADGNGGGTSTPSYSYTKCYLAGFQPNPLNPSNGNYGTWGHYFANGSTGCGGLFSYGSVMSTATRYAAFAGDAFAGAFIGGNVGIGTTTPITALDVNEGQIHQLYTTTIADYTGSQVRLRGSSTTTYYPSISFYYDGTSTGNQWYGTSAAQGFLAYSYTGSGYVPVNASAFNVNSDITLKKDITHVQEADLEGYLKQIRDIESITYRYKDEYTSEAEAAGGKVRVNPHVGFSAQSLPPTMIAMMPTSGKVNAEMKLGYNLSDMAGLTLIGIKALDVKTQAIEKMVSEKDQRITALENENADLKLQMMNMNDCIQSLCNAQNEKTGVTNTNADMLFQNQPNPFNQTTVIRYALSKDIANGFITIRDLNGNLVKQIPVSKSGKGQVTINANELAQGTYTYTLEISGESIDTKLMVVTK